MSGSFPCQGFSLSGPRKIDDSRNVLYKHYVNIVRRNRPKAFIGENVKGLLTMGKGKIIDAIIADFSECGYDVYCKLLNAKNFGVPPRGFDLTDGIIPTDGIIFGRWHHIRRYFPNFSSPINTVHSKPRGN